ncbi:tight adherence protein B [Aquisalibacillus elongatus]|uniref:Tight adherence protein B n=1 Tax=Aquisalibacillus elongatus TaxID=485577 RepID=A0A3N5CF00_9BACI|nr:tight adherence protein B [Aquisalibacillus elongatus]
MDMVNLLIIGILFLLFFTLFIVIGFMMFGKKKRIHNRLEDYFPNLKQKPEQEQKAMLNEFVKKLGEYLPWQLFNRKWEKKLILAGIKLKVNEFMAIRGLVTIIIFTLLMLSYNIWIAIASILIVWFWLTHVYIKIKTKRRLDRSVTQLAASLGTMANAMRAGFSFMQAMQMVAREMPDPIGPEFEATIKEINLGVSYEVAFDRLLERLPNKDLEMVISSILIQRTSGGNLAVLLETLRDTINGRLRVKEEVKTLTAQGRISTWIISLLPIGLALIINIIHPTFFDPLFTHFVGWIMLFFGAIFFVLGWIIIRRIVQIEV